MVYPIIKGMNHPDELLIFKWLELAVLAPSAGNAQPWDVFYEKLETGYRVTLFLAPECLSHRSVLDTDFVTSAVAIGCFAENFLVAASLDGFRCVKTETTGDSAQTWRWIYTLKPRTKFIEHHREISDSYTIAEKVLRERVSNRTFYKRQPIASIDTESVQQIVSFFPDIRLKNVTHQRSDLISVLSLQESIRLREKRFRDELFSEFCTLKEAQENLVGLPIKTLSLSGMQRIMLYTLKKIKAMQVVVGWNPWLFSFFSLFLPMTYSGDIFILQSNQAGGFAAANLGLVAEKLWLFWTAQGYAVQMVALPLLAHTCGPALSDDSRSRLIEAQNRAQSKM